MVPPPDVMLKQSFPRLLAVFGTTNGIGGKCHCPCTSWLENKTIPNSKEQTLNLSWPFILVWLGIPEGEEYGIRPPLIASWPKVGRNWV
jgi:hypothetical protein